MRLSLEAAPVAIVVLEIDLERPCHAARLTPLSHLPDNLGEMSDTLSAAAARRVALAAQGLGRQHPASVGTRQLSSLVSRLGLLQIDSVNVFERSHYLPAFARLGGYDRALLDRLTYSPSTPRSESGFTELWAHEAAFVPVADYPLFGFRQQRFRERYFAGKDSWGLSAGAETIAWLRDELAAKGPLAASEIEHDANVRRGPWWGWSEVKQALEVMFRSGELATAGRTRFERRYALVEHVLPSSVLGVSVPVADAARELVRKAARAHGIGTVGDLADYYRLSNAAAKQAVDELVADGELIPVRVNGWQRSGRPLGVDKPNAYLHREARVPRKITATALLSPFDPVVWERDRLLRMFGMSYRIEIYTPAPKRLFGYYNLPLLIDDEIVGRIDLKSDRQGRVLRVQSAWVEEGFEARAGEIAERLVPLLRETAAWQGLGEITVSDWGTLTPALGEALRADG